MVHNNLGEGDLKRGKFRSICSIHQEIYQILNEMPNSKDKEKLLALLQEAFECGIRMDKKLTEYANRWKKQVYESKK